MQLSDQRTDHIVFKADASDEWTFINCAIVKISNMADSLLNAHIAVGLLKPSKDLWDIRFWNSAADFLYLDSDEHKWVDELGENKSWSFLEITEEELDELVSKQEVRTESGLLSVDADEKFRFLGYTKYTGVEMATEYFTLEQLGIAT